MHVVIFNNNVSASILFVQWIFLQIFLCSQFSKVTTYLTYVYFLRCWWIWIMKDWKWLFLWSMWWDFYTYVGKSILKGRKWRKPCTYHSHQFIKSYNKEKEKFSSKKIIDWRYLQCQSILGEIKLIKEDDDEPKGNWTEIGLLQSITVFFTIAFPLFKFIIGVFLPTQENKK